MKKKRMGIVLLLFILVLSLPVQAARLNRKKAAVAVGRTVQLRLNGAKKPVRWSSSNRKVAAVTQAGKVRGKKAGKTVITAVSGGKKYKCVVTVKRRAGSGGAYQIRIGLSQTTAYMKVGEKLQLKAKVTPAGVGKIEWYSLDKGIASVKGGLVTARSEGVTEIVASVTKGKSTAWISCGVAVSAADPSSESSSQSSSESSSQSSSTGSSESESESVAGTIEYGLSSTTISVGKDVTVTVTYTGSCNPEATSTDPSVLKLDQNSVISKEGEYKATFRGLKAGETTIRIRDIYGGYSDKDFAVTVKE